MVEMFDDKVPETKQPYHAGMGTLETNQTRINKRREIIEAVTKKSIAGLLKSCDDNGYIISNAVLVIGSDIDPATIANDHIRAHALEGQLFRSVLQNALNSNNVPVEIIVKRNLFAVAQKKLNRSQNDLKRILTGLGSAIGKPWRTDEKEAVLAAWMYLE